MHRIAPDDCCLTIVIAAFNEAEALPVLQPRIATALALAEAGGLEARVLYVDDGSRDATGTCCAASLPPTRGWRCCGCRGISARRLR